jgi:Flp pilus assembly protein TadG
MAVRRRAQATVEFALILPIYLLIVAGTVELGRAFFAYAQLLHAAQDGVRYGAVLHKDDTDIRARVQQAAPGGASDTVTISATISPTNNGAVAAADRRRGNLLRVSAQHNQAVLVPLFPLSSFPLTANATMVIE